MKYRMQGRALNLLLLLALSPLLVGHGLGLCLSIDGCEGTPSTDSPPPTILEQYTVSGGDLPQTEISVGSELTLGVAGMEYISDASAAGGVIPPLEYWEKALSEAPHDINVLANTGDGAANMIGELWVHTTEGVIKLLHPVSGSSFLAANMALYFDDLSVPQQTITNGSTDYLLSGGIDATESIVTTSPFTLYLNGVAVYVNGSADLQALPYIPIAAQPGDELRIVAGDVAHGYYHLPTLWLHAPTGVVTKLFHHMAGNMVRPDGYFMDATFVLD